MSNNNSLTTIANSFTIEADVVSALPGIRADAMSPVLYCTWEYSSFIPERGVFCVSSKSKKTFYGSTKFRQQKNSSGKLFIKRHLKDINYILSDISDFVKGKFETSILTNKVLS